MTCKWTFARKVRLQGNDNLAKLLQFYLWETPVPDTSQKGKTFKEYGWSKSNYATLHARMRRCSGFPDSKAERWVESTASRVENALAKLGRLDGYDCSFEFAVHTVKDGLNKTEALFYLIRNAFAHGGFRVSGYEGKKYYVFENRQGCIVKGRAILEEQTLLDWIVIVKSGP
ncbi:MAG: hypothetical protein IKG22_12630 [Atopobiaceae bacterium]|nr:hypothetical protein [Atopobiaceae bacterium]